MKRSVKQGSKRLAAALPTEKYHVALSFAGEDRKYVAAVATRLAASGVSVFYDKFEEATLWGKDLYVHLRDVYENKAIFTVMFISGHYRDKVWTNHERESAQARAFESNREYILPAYFDESVKVPGMLKTTGRISLKNRTPEDLAGLIVEKLEDSGVELSEKFSYSEEAKADVDFPRPKGSKVSKIIADLKSSNWYTQSPSIDAIFELDWETLGKDEIFVLGRNIYQCACGAERRALAILDGLREKLADVPSESAIHLLNGMFFEVYFDKTGEFRGRKLKGQCLNKLMKLQTVKKFEPSISFIRTALQPYKGQLPIIPCTTPEVAIFELTVRKSDPPMVKSVTINGHELLTENDEEYTANHVWKLSFRSFNLERLKSVLADAWSIPLAQLTISFSEKIDSDTEYRLPKGTSIKWPEEGIS